MLTSKGFIERSTKSCLVHDPFNTIRCHISGGQYSSRKLWSRVQDCQADPMFLTLLTRQFLIEGVMEREGQQRIDNNSVNSRSYNVAFYNQKQKGLKSRKKLVIMKSPLSGRLEVYHQ